MRKPHAESSATRHQQSTVPTAASRAEVRSSYQKARDSVAKKLDFYNTNGAASAHAYDNDDVGYSRSSMGGGRGYDTYYEPVSKQHSLYSPDYTPQRGQREEKNYDY